MTVLSVESLSVSNTENTFLNNISFHVNAGDIVAVIGPNGAGKSSLLNAISGESAFQNMSTTGSIRIADKNLKQWNTRQRAKHLAYLKQHSSLEFPFTVFDVVSLGRMPHDCGLHLDQKIVIDAIEAMDIKHLLTQAYTQLSGGEKQRVQLARVLAQVWRAEDAKQRILLLDEPTNALDIEHKNMLMTLLQSFAKKGAAIVMVLHDFSFAAQYANKVLALKKGDMFAYGNVAEVMTKKHLEELFNTTIYILSHPLSGKPLIVG